jgi:hypothetical protein
VSKISLEGNVSGSGTLTISAPNTNSNFTLSLPQGTGTFVASGVNSSIVSGTAQASTSGTSIDFTGIPSWVKRITVMFSGVSTNGSSNLLVQLGDSGGVENTGYASGAGIMINAAGSATLNSTAGFIVVTGSATNINHALMTISIVDSSTNTWASGCSFALSNAAVAGSSSGNKSLSATLDRIRITTVNGTDTFDAGSINILYE